MLTISATPVTNLLHIVLNFNASKSSEGSSLGSKKRLGSTQMEKKRIPGEKIWISVCDFDARCQNGGNIFDENIEK
jgi:hypothetical protein